MRYISSDQVVVSESTSQTELPTCARCWASLSWASLLRSNSSATLRSVMSLDTPMTPAIRPSRSRYGDLVERKMRTPPGPGRGSSKDSATPVSRVRRPVQYRSQQGLGAAQFLRRLLAFCNVLDEAFVVERSSIRSAGSSTIELHPNCGPIFAPPLALIPTHGLLLLEHPEKLRPLIRV